MRELFRQNTAQGVRLTVETYKHSDDIRASNRHDSDRCSSGVGVLVVREEASCGDGSRRLVDESCVQKVVRAGGLI